MNDARGVGGSRLPKRTAWFLTYQDMVSLLVVFFVLFFAISQPRPEEIDRKETPAVGNDHVIYGTPTTRKSPFPGWWSPLGHIEFPRGPIAFAGDQLRWIEDELVPRVRSTSSRVVLVGLSSDSCDDSVSTAATERARAVRDYLVGRDVDPSRLWVFESACSPIFEPILRRTPVVGERHRVEVFLASR